MSHGAVKNDFKFCKKLIWTDIYWDTDFNFKAVTETITNTSTVLKWWKSPHVLLIDKKVLLKSIYICLFA